MHGRGDHMANEKTVIMDNSGIKRAITRISHEILERNKGMTDVVLIGIRSGGIRSGGACRECTHGERPA